MTEPLSEDAMDELLEDCDLWTYTEIRCELCDHQHISVHIVGIERVECPKCGHMTPADTLNGC